jgi:hypothetical protein
MTKNPELTENTLGGLFYLAQAEVEDAVKLQPGDWLVHANDVQEVLNVLQGRIHSALGWES